MYREMPNNPDKLQSDYCMDCERALKHCECLSKDMQVVRVLLIESGHLIPTVVVKYGAIADPTTRPACYKSFSEFDSLVKASEFAKFLNSDSIFDCQIPSIFLRKEKVE